jgi:sterol desaturase/sphingolipid hydroxylase (fatty acid hydroxylase superfamily)
MTLPTILVMVFTVIFLISERVFPGRELPKSKGWYWRALLVNLTQLGITLATATLWIRLIDVSVFRLSAWNAPIAEGFVGWLVGTFFFYWWHVLRHQKGFWLLFHQIHHSPSRIELVTSFYKHPIEILSDALLSALVLYPLLGCSMMGAFWYNFFAATGEYFYHANIRTPKWLRYFIQTPELHSIHHEYDVHNYNFSDIPIWDRLFGTYRDATEFANRCGFPTGAEQRLTAMLMFRDVYRESPYNNALQATPDDGRR